MAAVFACCISALFSAWVWQLKSEIVALQGHPIGPGDPRGARPLEEMAERLHHADAAPTEGSRTRPKRRDDGVPMWTIE